MSRDDDEDEGDPPSPPQFAPPQFAPPQFAPPQFAPASAAPPIQDEPAPAPAPDAPPPVEPPPAVEAAAPPEEPLLPAAATENDLRAAVGVPTRPERIRAPRRPPTDDGDEGDGGGGKPRSRKLAIIGGLTAFAGLGIATLVLLGRVNSERYVFACEPEAVVAEQGRTFPPWGTSALDGAPWRPIPIPPNAECRERETEDLEELGGWYLDMLVDRATSLLTQRQVTKVDEAAALLEQALLHTRSPARRDQRKETARLLGDVGYWRASARLREASTALAEAAVQFDAAAAQRPRHVSDASAWATFVRKVITELEGGPDGVAPAAFPPLPPSERPRAPDGVALPVEPPPAPADARAAEPPDAGVPTGGVLL